ncbi:hypothetical protein ACFXGA_06225 [Actinosynnema sp. NPDC059335]|uniref:hypothetical protein n=1 Tax=Actinosynnema sp. NPDC059335 TaxID=3346804 RepID=UPI00366EEA85
MSSGNTWARLRGQLVLWPAAGFAWAAFGGGWVSHVGYPWPMVLVAGLVLTVLALLIGRVLVRPGAASPEGQRARRWAGRCAALFMLVTTGWCVYAARHEVLAPPDLAAFGVLAAAMLPVAVMYAHVRALLLEHGDKQLAAMVTRGVASPSVPVADAQLARDEAPTVTTSEAVEWLSIVSGDELLGRPRVIGWSDTWCGFDVTVELDPSRDDTASSVATKLSRINGRAARRFKQRGVVLPEGAVRLLTDPDLPADVVRFRVITRDVLREDVPVEPVRGVSINEGIRPVRREDGEYATFDVRDEHGLVSGASRSGKSTYEWEVWRQLLSTRAEDDASLNDVLVWTAGGAKLPDLVGPFLQPLADGRAVRPVLDYVSDPSWEETKKWLRVVATVVHIRHSAPLGVFKRDRNKIMPLASQPLIWCALEEADEVVKNPEPIELPFTGKKNAGQIVTYVGSKGLSARVIFELMAQGTTEAMLGAYASSIKQNFLRRAVFRTEQKVHGQWLLPTGSNLDSSALRHKSMFLKAEGIDSIVAAKAPYLDEERVIPELAIDLQDHVTTLEDYTQQKLIELLGDDYAARWSRARTQGWREYFAAVGEFPSLEDATPPHVREAVRAGTSAGTSGTGSSSGTTAGTAPGAGTRSPGTPGEKDGVQGRWFGTFFVPDRLGAASPRPAGGGEDVPEEWRGLLDEIQGLDVAEPVRPVRHPVPEPLARIVAALEGDDREFVSNADLAAIVGVDDTTALGKELRDLGVPGRKRGDARGRYVAELRAAAEAWRRGERPTAADD